MPVVHAAEPAGVVDEPLCTAVRRSCATVSSSARWIELDDEGLDRLAVRYLSDRPTGSGLSSDAGDLDAGDLDATTLTFALDAINFGSGYHDHVAKRPGASGARTMAAALVDHVESTGPLTPDRLRAMSAADCSHIFGQPLDPGPHAAARAELMGLFSSALADLGAFLEAGGGAIAVVEATGRSAEQLAATLTAMPFYRDTAQLDGTTVCFYKRAQITAADLCRRSGRTLFDDLDRLTAFADNLVPHVLRLDGAIHLRPELASTIEAGRLLEPGGREEIELRAAAVTGVEELAARTGARPMDLDLWLWETGSGARFKAVPRPRVRSVFY